MIGPARVSGPASAGAAVLGALVTAALALGAAPALSAETCPNSQVRAESNVNPATGQPFSTQLPDCRAYEMVSPLDKGQHGVLIGELTGKTILPIAVAPLGQAVGWNAEGAFAQPEGFLVVSGALN